MLPQLPIPYHAALQLYSYPVLLFFINYFAKSAEDSSDLVDVFVKVLPVLTLAFVLTKRHKSASTKYAQRIRKGLLWSAVGDALLVYIRNDACSVLGAASFVMAHVQYKRAFQHDGKGGGGGGDGGGGGGGRGSTESPLCPVLVLLSVPVLMVLGPGHSFLLGSLAKGYLVFLFYVMSKAFNKFWHVQQARSYAAVFGLIGAAAFIASDILLLSKELAPGREGGNFLIMLTYFAAQFGLAASALE